MSHSATTNKAILSNSQGKNITLNCDMGESFGTWAMGQDELLMPLIDCANIACGFHAGDASVMRKTLELAKANDVEVGAHTGFPDLQGFGRRNMNLSAQELRDCLHYQIAALCGMAKLVGTQVTYVKPHGAMYNQMMQDLGMLEVIMQAVSDYPAPLDLMLQSTPDALKHQMLAKKLNLSLRLEVFSDRAYQDTGALVSRADAGALLATDQAILQSRSLVEEGVVKTISGNNLSLNADSICIHGDSPNAVAITEGISQNQ